MSDLKTIIPFTSRTTPGVTGVVRKITFGARTELRKRLAAVNERRSDLLLDRQDLVDELAVKHNTKPDDLKFSDLTQREIASYEKISNQIEICDDEISAAYLETCFVSLAAVGADGKPDVATVDGEPVSKANVAKLPPELAQEMVQIIRAGAEVSGEKEKNSQSPSTSAKAEGPGTSDSTAGSASEKGSTEPASVASSQS